MQAKLKDMDTSTAKHLRDELHLRDLALAAPSSSYRFLVNSLTSAHHLCVTSPEAPSHEWSTRCGWKFAPACFSFVKELPEKVHYKLLCKRCFPETRAARKATVVANAMPRGGNGQP